MMKGELIMGKLKKRKDGRYMKWLVLQDGTRKPVYARSKPELNKKIKELQRADECGLIIDDKTTVGEWGIKWFDIYKSALRGNTQAWYSNALNNHIIPIIGDIPLKEVKPAHAQEVMNKVAQYSEDLQRKVLNTMKQMFRSAITNKLMLYNPCEDIKITKHSTTRKIKVLSEDQKQALLEAVSGLRAELFVYLGLFCGLRREESLGLLWSDIDLQNAKLTVRRATTFVVNKADEDHSLKAKSSNRTIPIPDILLDLLKKEKAKSSSIYVVPNASGGEMTLSAFRRLWLPVEKSVNFRVTTHMLRHTYCTSLIEGGLDIKTVQYLMGHADIKTTLQYYAHVREKQLQSATAKVNTIFGCSQNCSQNIGSNQTMQK